MNAADSEALYRTSRRTVLTGASAAALSALAMPLHAAAPADPLQDWLLKNAVAIHSLDATSDDFSDLEPLADAIGNARVVQLGEPSHGAGTAFLAKARLVKFLHQRLGFDVLIWESGFYDVSLAQAGMRGSDDALTAARRGLFSLWTEASEARAVFEYVKSSQSSPRPIDLAGFDMQTTANESVGRYGPELQAFTTGLRDPTLRERATALAATATDARQQLFRSGFKSRQDFDTLSESAQTLRALIQSHRSAFDTVRGVTYVSFIERTIINVLADAAQRLEAAQSSNTTPERENRRDALNAENVRWLLNEQYARRKAVIWAHNVHVMRAWYSPDFHDVHLKPGPHDMKPTGVYLAQWLGRDLYTIGLTTYEGDEGLAVGGPVTPIPAAPNGSLESLLHAQKLPFAFLDLRSATRSSPIRRPLIARLPKFESQHVEDAGKVYDGILYIDQMERARR